MPTPPIPPAPAGGPGMVPMLAYVVLIGAILLAVVAIPQVRHHVATRVFHREPLLTKQVRSTASGPENQSAPRSEFDALDFSMYDDSAGVSMPAGAPREAPNTR
jgi:hypothetical protein